MTTTLAARSAGLRNARQHAVPLAVACLSALSVTCAGGPSPPPAVPPQRITIALPSADAAVAPLAFLITQTRLVRLDQSGLEQPALIERWTRSPDQRTWTLFVREGVRTHDGQEATAAYVVTRIQEALASDYRGPGLWPVTSVEQAGPREVRLHLSEPSSLLLDTLSHVQAVPAGPFRGPEGTAAAPEFHAVPQPGQPIGQVQSIGVRRYPTARAAAAALLRGDVDVLYEMPGESRELVEGEDGVQVFPNVKPYVVTLGLNHRHPVLRRRDVRLAMNIAVDRQALISQVSGGVGRPATDMIWNQHWTRPHTDDARAFPVDRRRAGQLLDAAGLERRVAPTGGMEPRFRVSCLVVDHTMMQRVAARLQQAYADVGIALDLQPVALDDFEDRLASGDFDTFVSPVLSGYGVSMHYTLFGDHDQWRMITLGYTAAAPAAERIRYAATGAELREAVHALHRVLIDDPPAVHLFWQETSRAVGRRVTVPADPSVDVLGSLARWTIRSATP